MLVFYLMLVIFVAGWRLFPSRLDQSVFQARRKCFSYDVTVTPLLCCQGFFFPGCGGRDGWCDHESCYCVVLWKSCRDQSSRKAPLFSLSLPLATFCLTPLKTFCNILFCQFKSCLEIHHRIYQNSFEMFSADTDLIHLRKLKYI